VIAVLLVWGALAMPALCGAGALEHLCACGTSGSCAHEESCSTDPCFAARPTDGNTAPLLSPALLLAPVAIAPLAESPEAALLRSSGCRCDGVFVVPTALRFGTRPLLI
jgi:hypothetical protein